MKLAIFQPYFFPYLGYFQLISAVDEFILYDNLNYIRKGWVNRNRLLTVHGQPAYFVVPLKGKSIHLKIRDILIDNQFDWRKKKRKQIELNYRRSPYFNEIYPLVEKTLTSNEDYLTVLNCSTIQAVCSLLGIQTKIVTEVSEYDALEAELNKKDSELIASYYCQQGLEDIKTIRGLEICRREGAGIFINSIGGQVLYDKQTFARNGIDLYFLQARPYTYYQNSKEFFPALSILDVLMNCGKAGTRRLLNEYELI